MTETEVAQGCLLKETLAASQHPGLDAESGGTP